MRLATTLSRQAMTALPENACAGFMDNFRKDADSPSTSQASSHLPCSTGNARLTQFKNLWRGSNCYLGSDFESISTRNCPSSSQRTNANKLRYRPCGYAGTRHAQGLSIGARVD